MRHKDKAILYWFGPPESKTLCPFLRFALLHGEITWRPFDGLLVVLGRTPLPALYWTTDKVGGRESRSVTTGKPISSLFTSWKAYPSCLNSSGLPCLARQAVISFGESSRRSSEGHVGCQLGQLGPLTGRRVFW
jgi:hypothetical protein